jgi:hypothetical protein
MKIHLLHIGKTIPKRLLSHGWRETGHSIHHGHGLWTFRLEKEKAAIKNNQVKYPVRRGRL